MWAQNALKPNELLVALVYAKYAGATDPRTQERAAEDIAWVTWAELSERTKIRSKTGLNNAVKGLVAGGWLEQVEPRRQHRAPRYRLTFPANPEVRETYFCEEAAS
ncbi:MarR family transcriptional regulator [Nocardioides sp. J2M5]|uniref:MarR family transcriptional regulator n=1 Tax=Nocardioides palaemonis TaxID=2829810 RepID=UPI001BA9EEDE|nr:helix-turn-helix domain-containing protein [Nocardioides palaemonis]MBS2939579.1 MarR family transcriptional regulator [Nocardioides palaemonis]